MEEKYVYEVGDEGLDYVHLNHAYNPSTQSFIEKAGIQPGMHVLDVGCGDGVMTAYLAQKVGPEGSVTAIDSSQAQVDAAMKRLTAMNISNVNTHVLSAYDIKQLNQQFDVIYCRFVLHHLHYPRKTLRIFYDHLKKNGLYIGQEGIVSSIFAFPPSFAWQGYFPSLQQPGEDKEGARDPDLGMKLLYYAKATGFDILGSHLMQPILWKKKQKEGILFFLKIYKKTAIELGMTEQEWQEKYRESVRLVEDDNQVLGFYGSCLVCGIKR